MKRLTSILAVAAEGFIFIHCKPIINIFTRLALFIYAYSYVWKFIFAHIYIYTYIYTYVCYAPTYLPWCVYLFMIFMCICAGNSRLACLLVLFAKYPSLIHSLQFAAKQYSQLQSG